MIGIDLTDGHFAIARALASARAVANVTFEVTDVYTLPFDDGTFDAVFANGLLLHLRDCARLRCADAQWSPRRMTTMLTVTNSVLVHRYYDDISNQPDPVLRAAAADELLTVDFVFHKPNDIDGKVGIEQHKAWLVWHHTVAPDQGFTVDNIVADETRGSARWRLIGTHAAEFLGIPPTGRGVDLTGLDYFLFADGRITELWRAFDLRELVRQISAPKA